MDTAKKLYDEENKKKSILGLSKGYVNFLKVSYTFYGRELSQEILLIYPNAKIYTVSTQSALNKMVKDNIINRETISNNLVIVISDKLTVETIFNRHKIPYFKFIGGSTTRSYKQSDGTQKRENRFTWRKEGDKGFSWEKGTGLSLKRENILEALFEED
jgi:hypothetical protein